MSHTRRSISGRSRRQQKQRGPANSSRRRLAHLERLEDRVMLAADMNPWHNDLIPRDVNRDYQVSALDALITINALNDGGPRELGDLLASNMAAEASEGEARALAMFDVNNDRYLSPLDALSIINGLNAGEDPPKLVRAEALLTQNVAANGETPVTRPPVTTAAPGETVLLNVYVEDIRTDDGVFRDSNSDGLDDSDEFGVYAAYFDVNFDPTAFSVPSGQGINPNKVFNFPIKFVNPAHETRFGSVIDNNLIATQVFNYPNGPSGELDRAAGVIDEAGGFTGLQKPYGKQLTQVPEASKHIFTNQHVFDVPFVVQSLFAVGDQVDTDEGSAVQIDVLSNDGLVQGNYDFSLNAADAVAHALLTFGDNATGSGSGGQGSVVPAENILFVQDTINVPAGNRQLVFDGLTQQPSKGSVIPGTAGVLTYTPDPGAVGVDTFVYQVSDSIGGVKTATVTVNITALNDPPVIAAPAAPSVDEDEVLAFQGSNAVSIADADGDSLSVSLAAAYPLAIADGSGATFTDADGADGTLAFNGSVAQVNAALAGLTLTPASDFFGSTQLVITADDAVTSAVSQTVAVTVEPINDAPALTVPGSQLVQTDALPLSITGITVSDAVDAQFAPSALVVGRLTLSSPGSTLTATNPGTLVVGGSGTDTLTLTGTVTALNTALGSGIVFSNAVGVHNLTATYNDLGSVDKNGAAAALEVEDTIEITIVPPTRPFAANDSFTVLEDSSAAGLDVLSNDFNFDNQQGTNLVILSVADPANGTVVNNGTGLIYTPDADFFGADVFTYTIEDTVNEGDGPSTATVTVNVTGVNDQPDFTASSPVAVNEDAGAQSLAGWADFDPGQPNEAAQQVLAYLVADVSNPGLFASGPSITPSGTLQYTPAVNASGTSTFSVAVQDDGGTANGGIDTSARQTFTVTVNPVNDPPTFAAADPPRVTEDSGPHTISSWATDFDPGAEDEAVQQLLGYSVTVLTNAGLFASAPSVADDGTLTYALAPDAFGTATFEVTVQDDGGGSDTSVPQTFSVTVDPVNDAPSFSASDPSAVGEDSGAQTVPGWVTSFDPGPDNESSQQVAQYIVSGVSNPALFAAGPAVAPNGTLTYTPAAEMAGTATFSVAVQDDGGTADGGIDTSAVQVFTITVNAENDAPINRINGSSDFAANSQSTDDNVDLAFSAANGNLLSITDVDDDGSAAYSAQLSVTNGTLLLGLSDSPATTKTITGTRAQVNAALASLIFRPTTGFIGSAVLTISSDDGGTSGAGAVGTDVDQVTIAVAPINDPPVAQDDEIAAAEGDTVEFNVLADNGNGADSAGPNESQFQDIDVVSFDTSGTAGTVELLDAETGQFRYTPPDDDFNGVTTFTYIIQDNGQSLIGGSIVDDFKTAVGTVTITVAEVNDAPVAADDLLLTAPQPALGQVFTFSVADLLGNDSPGPANESGQSLQVISVSSSAKGATITIDDQGTADPADDEILYTVPAGFDHFDTFEYTVQDDGTTGGLVDPLTDTATVTVRDVVMSTIAGYVYVDAGGDGVKGAGERGVGGVLINLTGTDITGNAVQLATRTDEQGFYEFADLLPSQEGTQYVVSQVQPMAYLDGLESGGNGGASPIANDQIGVFLPLIGFDPQNPDESATRDNNFGELGLTAYFAGVGFSDLLHSGMDSTNPLLHSGWLFGTDAQGNLQWYIDLGRWDEYIPGQRSATLDGWYQVEVIDGHLQVTDGHEDAQRDLSVAPDSARLRQVTNGNSTITHIIGSPEFFGLPGYDLAELGEGEGQLSDAEIEAFLADAAGDGYSEAVDAVFAGVA